MATLDELMANVVRLQAAHDAILQRMAAALGGPGIDPASVPVPHDTAMADPEYAAAYAALADAKRANYEAQEEVRMAAAVTQEVVAADVARAAQQQPSAPNAAAEAFAAKLLPFLEQANPELHAEALALLGG